MCALSCFITKIILRCAVSKTLKKNLFWVLHVYYTPQLVWKGWKNRGRKLDP